MPAIWNDTFVTNYFSTAYTVTVDTHGYTVAPNLLTVAANGAFAFYDHRQSQNSPYLAAVHVTNSATASQVEIGFANPSGTWTVAGGVVSNGTELLLGIISPSFSTSLNTTIVASENYWIMLSMNAQGHIAVSTTDNPTPLTYNAGSTFVTNFEAVGVNPLVGVNSAVSIPTEIVEWKYGVEVADPRPVYAYTSGQAQETGDTINRIKAATFPTILDFAWTPFTSTTVEVGTVTVPIHETPIYTPITFVANVTLPPNRSVVNYEWKMGDGTVYQTGSPTVTHEYIVANFQARASLVITDDLGNTYSCGHQLYLTTISLLLAGDWTWMGSSIEANSISSPILGKGGINYEGSAVLGIPAINASSVLEHKDAFYYQSGTIHGTMTGTSVSTIGGQSEGVPADWYVVTGTPNAPITSFQGTLTGGNNNFALNYFDRLGNYLGADTGFGPTWNDTLRSFDSTGYIACEVTHASFSMASPYDFEVIP